MKGKRIRGSTRLISEEFGDRITRVSMVDSMHLSYQAVISSVNMLPKYIGRCIGSALKPCEEKGEPLFAVAGNIYCTSLICHSQLIKRLS